MSREVLFVCTGNSCRSPLAEAMARAALRERGLDLSVSSAGTSAREGGPASDGSILVGLERGLDLSPHRARMLTRERVEAATLILAMGPHHVAQVRELGGDGKVFLLTDYAGDPTNEQGILDPFGGGLDAYRRMADELDRVMPHVVERLAAPPGEEQA